MNMDFLQSLRVSQLSEQFTYWSDAANINARYANLHRRIDNKGVVDNFVVQKWNDGYITYEYGTLKYEEITTGKTFILRKNFTETDYQCYTELYEAGKASGKFRCNQPIFRTVVPYGSGSLEYTEYLSPKGEYGMNTLTRRVTVTPVEDVKQFAMDLVDDVAELIREIKVISAKHNTGFPAPLVFAWERYKDSDGYYYSEMLDWNATQSDFVEYLLLFMVHHMEITLPNRGEINDIVTYARTSWQ